MRVEVRMVKGGTPVWLNVEPTDTILAVKEKLNSQHGVGDAASQTLIYRGSVMSNSTLTVSELGIKEGGFFVLMVRVTAKAAAPGPLAQSAQPSQPAQSCTAAAASSSVGQIRVREHDAVEVTSSRKAARIADTFGGKMDNIMLQELNLSDSGVGVQGAKAVAAYLAVTTTLTHLNLGSNELMDEGTITICDALKESKVCQRMKMLQLQDNAIAVKGAVSVAAYMAVGTTLTTLNLSSNRLCGLRRASREEDPRYWDPGQIGTYTVEGIAAIANALRVTTSLTVCSLEGNYLKEEGWCAIFNALRSNEQNKIQHWTLGESGVNATIVKSLAPYVASSASLTSLDLSYQDLTGDTAWIDIDQVAGDSFNKGDKVIYQGREMIITGCDHSEDAIRMRPTDWFLAILAIVDAVRMNASLMAISRAGYTGSVDRVGLNFRTGDFGGALGDEGWGAIIAAVCSSNVSQIASINASSENIGSTGAKLIGEALRASVSGSRSLRSLILYDNKFGPEGERALAAGVSVASLTELDVREKDDPWSTSVHGAEGEGASLLSAAVLANSAIEVFNEIPVKEMRADSLTELNLARKNIGVAGCIVVAGLVPGQTSLTSIDLSWNAIDADDAKALAAAVAASASLKLLNLSNNIICGIGGECGDGSGSLRGAFSLEGVAAIAEVISKSITLQSVDLSNNAIAGLSRSGHGTFHTEGIKAIADALRVNSSLTRLNLSVNALRNGRELLQEVVRGREGFELIL